MFWTRSRSRQRKNTTYNGTHEVNSFSFVGRCSWPTWKPGQRNWEQRERYSPLLVNWVLESVQGMLVDWGVYFRVHNSVIAICVKSHPLHYTDCTSSNSISPLDEQSLWSLVSLLSHSLTPLLSLAGLSSIVMLSVTSGTTLSLFWYSFLFQMCFQCLSWPSSVTSDTESLLPFCIVLKFTSPVLFPSTSLIILACISSVGFRSHVGRQLNNCMIMINMHGSGDGQTFVIKCDKRGWEINFLPKSCCTIYGWPIYWSTAQDVEDVSW